MPNGFGRGMGRGSGGSGGGTGFGFRGSSPPWPYVGRGRGGLPRCGYFLSGAASPAFGNAPFGSQVSPEQELDSLRNQAEAMGEQLEQVEARMHDLENEKKETTE